MGGLQHVSHGFGPVFDARSRVLILGSFPSVRSRDQAFYYGNPQNRFWRVMAACLDAPVPVNEGDPMGDGAVATRERSIERKRALLLDHGVSVWDVIESCDIQGSSDASISAVEPVRIELISAVAPIERVVCNGRTAAALYRRHLERRCGLSAEALPSTSPANAAWSLERLISRWREVIEAALGAS